jgi:TolB-like protein
MTTPSPEAVRAALERIVASEAFRKSPRMSRLLKYVVERSLAGEAEQLKEYVLGVEVFDRDERYDPRLDSIVRVEARRLRAKLHDYYQGPGGRDPVTIDMPRGSYVPVFTTAEHTAAADPPSDTPYRGPAPGAPGGDPQRATSPQMARPGEVPRVRGRRWAMGLGAVAGAAVLLLAVALSALWAPGPDRVEEPAEPAAPRIAVLPFVHFSTEPDVAMLAARITDGVTTELARLGTLSVVSRTSAAQFMSDERPVAEVAQILEADLIIEGSAILEHERVTISARLVDGSIDRKLWVGDYTGTLDELGELQRRIAAEAGPVALKRAASRSDAVGPVPPQ